jgi:hypothetical protein
MKAIVREPLEPRCENCAFWLGNVGRTDNRECRKRAPIRGTELGQERLFPITFVRDVCGDFKERD